VNTLPFPPVVVVVEVEIVEVEVVAEAVVLEADPVVALVELVELRARIINKKKGLLEIKIIINIYLRYHKYYASFPPFASYPYFFPL
jgi:hypothetical protein